MATLPTPGGDSGTWGTELNEFLVGTGDNVAYYVNGTAYHQGVLHGTAASPVTVGSGPTFKVARTEAVTEASMPAGIGANNQGNAAIWGASKGTVASEAQAVGVLATAESGSTQSSHNDDACGLAALGSVTGSGTGVGIGAYIEGRRDTNTGNTTGLEVAVRNYTNTNGTYTSTGFSDTTGIWLISRATNGATKNGVGLAIGSDSNVQFDVGIGFTSQGSSGPIATASIRDDSSSATSLLINGTHATAAIQVAANAGLCAIGTPAASAAQLIVQTNADARSAIVAKANSASQSVNIFSVQSSAGTELVSVGSSGNLRMIDTNMVFGTTTGTSLGTSASQKLSFWAATPAAQQVLATGTGKTVDNVITFLQSVGLCRQT